MKLYLALLTGDEDAVLADKMILINKGWQGQGHSVFYDWELPEMGPVLLEMIKKAEINKRLLMVDKAEKGVYNKEPVDKSESNQV